MSPPAQRQRRTTNSFPRVSGDEPQVSLSMTTLQEFSPRERG